MLQLPVYNPLDSLSPIRKIDFPEDTSHVVENTLFVYRTKRDTSITEVWNGTKISTETAVQTPFKTETPAEKYADMGIVIALIIFFLVATERIVEGLSRAFWASISVKRQTEIDEDLTLSVSRNITALFIIPTALFMASPTLEIFIWAIAICVVYLAVKYGIQAILDYVNQTTVFKFIGRMGLNFMIMAAPVLMLARINPYLSILCIIPAVMYLILASRIILKNNFSVFFYILYLCTLELLPAALLIRLFLQ